MENMGLTPEFWRDRRVFITGHTGFKGGWLSTWLHSLGAKVHGYALVPPTSPSMFEVARVSNVLESHTIADVRDGAALVNAVKQASPEIVFHMAAQPIVRASYNIPVETYGVNVMGTVNLFEAVRAQQSVRAIINVTSDKCYENRELDRGYTEDEPMGGYDPYSSSKGCAELVTSAYRSSFFAPSGVALASVRAGNVIGGGDWAEDRLLPDFLRALDAGKTLQIRSPAAVRPWQHVLEPLSGYILLAEQLVRDGLNLSGGWNFGPADADAREVRWIVDYLVDKTPGASWSCNEAKQPHEAGFLRLDSTKASTRLGWQPKWSLADALDKTLAWHAAWKAGKDMSAVSLSQISDYKNALEGNGSGRQSGGQE